MVAIERKSPELAKVLIEAGADVNFKDQEVLDSCLHRAVALQQKEIVQMLVKAGADVNAQNIFRETPLFKATVEPKGINLEIAEVLVLAKADTSALVTENGQSLLHVAVMRNETLSGSLRFLLRKGADELTAKVNRALEEIRNDGTYQQVYDRWLLVD